MIRKIKNKTEFILLVITIFQIFLLINMISANSYIIHQTDSLIENSVKEKSKTKKLIGAGINLLIGFLSIKQIGVVSAQNDEDGLWCCKKINGAVCEPINPEDSCDEDILMTDCDLTDYCKRGACLDQETGFCSEGSPKGPCEESPEGGIWNEDINNIEGCDYGCCTWGEINRQYITQRQCEILSNDAGTFDTSISQEGCIFYTEEMGACVVETEAGVSCTHKTEEQCEDEGDFYENYFCSADDLKDFGVNCDKEKYTGCAEEENLYDIYYFDSCNNREDVKEECNHPESKCINGVCKDLSCIDEEGNIRQNWESWCVYEGHVGDSRDVVGSKHGMRWCKEGEIKTDAFCDDYRKKICGEKINNEGLSNARCRFNEEWKCFELEIVSYEFDDDRGITNQEEVDEYKTECEAMSDCRIQSVDIYDKGDMDLFKFDICVPKYPSGFDITPNSETDRERFESRCEIASQTCTTIWRKGLIKWKCKANCECLNQEFAEQMNEFCISLGDCGGYVNVEGKYTKNFKVNMPNLGKNKYKNLDDYDFEEDITDVTKERYEAYAESIGGEPPQFFSSTEEGYWGGNPLEELELAGEVVDFSTIVNIIGGGIGVLGAGVTGSAILTAILSKVATAGLAHPAAAIIIFIVSVILLILSFLGIGKTKEITVEFKCRSWQPPFGGEDCDKCNNDPSRPCTEYKCESLGGGCRLFEDVYQQDYEEEKKICIHKQSNDTTPPQIVFEEIDEELYNVEEVDNGVKIRTSSGDCIQEFTPINFTLRTEDENGDDDYARCVYNWEIIDPPNPENNYALEGEEFEEGVYYSINHSFTEEQGRLPFVSSLDYATGNLGEREGELNMYVRCVDHAGMSNLNEYIINFCIKEGADNTITIIKEYNPESGSFLRYGETTQILVIDLDEPADCKWTHDTDKSYDGMENNMICEDYAGEIKPSWSCTTKLIDLTESVNNIYIKCKDQPWISEEDYDGPWTEENRNINTQGFLYTLKTTENPLEIASISPQGDIERGGDVFEIELEVTTSEGAYNGVSTCKYEYVESPLGIDSWDFFTEIDSYHTYPFNLPSGFYNILITCWDEAGNEAQGNAIFDLMVDSSAPIVVRAYKEGGKLKLITDENAKCYYNFKRCNPFDFDNATSMTFGWVTQHSANWITGETYYIKCEDIWGIRNSDCAIKIKSSSLI